MHFGEKDGHIPANEIRTIAASHPETGFFYYPADHGFGCDERATFHAESSDRLGPDARILCQTSGLKRLAPYTKLGTTLDPRFRGDGKRRGPQLTAAALFFEAASARFT